MLDNNLVNSEYFMRVFNEIFVCDTVLSVPEKLKEKPNLTKLRKAVYAALKKEERIINITLNTYKKFAKYIVKQSKAAGFEAKCKLADGLEENNDVRQDYNFVFKW